MTVQIGLLRAVNVGGATQVGMADLRARLTSMGFADVRSILQSGNVVFRSSVASSAAVEARLDRELAPMLPAPTEFFVRTAAEWRTAVAANPFPDEAIADPSHLVLTALKTAPSPTAWRALQAAIVGKERVRGLGRSAYIVYPDGQGRSKLSATFLERHLGTRGTSRNWNTVRKIDALASE
ncbi:MAG: DUF1697 domain-containing protein [Thermoplasmata archaeon]|nr:DUF1697 domain-containing protein [Thermoplasmata archaeon]MCI4354037.1 DUF1697 domain-containing protein [Thermoplasmata archaeon]